MFFVALDAGWRVVGPAIGEAGIAYMGGDLRVLLHPALPIGLEERMKFLRRGGLRGGLRLLRILCCGVDHERSSKRRAGDCDRQRYEQTNHHGFLPAAVASSLSRSRASMTMRRAVSAASMAVLSTRTGSAGGHRGG